MNQPDPVQVLEFRLPITYVRVAGSVDEVHDPCDPSPKRSYALAVTTETGSDTRTLQKVPLRIGGKADLAFSLAPDGRLLSTTVAQVSRDQGPDWTTAAKVAGAFTGLAAPALLAAGPPGWAVLGGGALLTGGAVLAATGARTFGPAVAHAEGDPDPTGGDVPADVPPQEAGVPEAYVEADPAAARELARYRLALAATRDAHSRTVLTASAATDGSGLDRARALAGLLRQIETGLASAEHRLEVWREKHKQISTHLVDTRLRVDELPTQAELKRWLSDASKARPLWHALVESSGTAVTIDLEEDEALGEPTDTHTADLDLLSSPEVRHRPPRPATLRVWRVTRAAKDAVEPHLLEIRRLTVAFPGNEREFALRSATQDQLDLVFEADGALTRVQVGSTSPALQRADQLSAAVTGGIDGVSLGQGLREALAPPSLVDRAAQEKAARELGLVPTAVDPLAELRRQHEEASLRAQIRLADQIASSTIPPVLVQFTG